MSLKELHVITLEISKSLDEKEAADRERFKREIELKAADLNRSLNKVLSLIRQQKSNKSPKLQKKIKKAVEKYNANFMANYFKVCGIDPVLFQFQKEIVLSDD